MTANRFLNGVNKLVWPGGLDNKVLIDEVLCCLQMYVRPIPDEIHTRHILLDICDLVSIAISPLFDHFVQDRSLLSSDPTAAISSSRSPLVAVPRHPSHEVSVHRSLVVTRGRGLSPTTCQSDLQYVPTWSLCTYVYPPPAHWSMCLSSISRESYAVIENMYSRLLTNPNIVVCGESSTYNQKWNSILDQIYHVSIMKS